VWLTRNTLNPQVLLEIEQLLLKSGVSTEAGVVKSMLYFLHAQGYRQQWELREQELRGCLVQLSAVLDNARFGSQVCPTETAPSIALKLMAHAAIVAIAYMC
jgi:hypothetical protein